MLAKPASKPSVKKATGPSAAATAKPAKSAPEAPKAPKAPTKSTAKSTTKSATKPAGKAAGKAAATKTPARPTLVELVREHLAGQREPRSAAEVATALGEAHSGRTVKSTVVRTTLEGLVAKNQAQRTKQGTSVYYTATEAPAPARHEEPADGAPSARSGS